MKAGLRTAAAVLVTALALGGAALPAQAMVDQKAGQAQTAKLDALQAEILSILEQAQAGQIQAAATRLDAVVVDPAFKEMDGDAQYVVVALQAAAHLQLEDYPKALQVYRRLTDMRPSDTDAWMARIAAADMGGDYAEAARSVMTVLRLENGGPSAFYDDYLMRLVRVNLLKAPDGRTLQGRLIDALATANWKAEASHLWVARAVQLLEAGDDARAGAMVARVTSPSLRAAMSADRRFDSLRLRTPGDFDVPSALERELDKARAQAEAADADLETVTEYAWALADRGRVDEALASLQEAMPGGRAVKPGAPQPDNDQLIWAMDLRSRLLLQSGRYDEAVTELRRASRRPENGGPNVSQAINLGWLYVKLDRPEEALDAVDDLSDGDLSDFGRMQYEQVRACAFHALGRQAEAKASAAFVQARSEHDPAAPAVVAACMGDEAAVARDLIARLDDPESRLSALSLAQTWMPTPHPTPRDLRLRAFGEAVLARADVRAAIDRHGRVQSWPMRTPPPF